MKKTTRNISLIPRAPVGRLALEAGAQRISAEGTESLCEILEKYALDISLKAVKIAKHSGRETIQDRDIKLAVQ